MKYIAIDSVVKAYQSFQGSMPNKSWGYLALLKCCGNIIIPSMPYKIELDDVSAFLEDIFNLDSNKKQYNGSRYLYVVFSNIWESFFKNQGKFSPNIFDVAAWAYRRRPFDDNVTSKDLLLLFAKEFNIPMSIITNSFDTTEKNIFFSNTIYRESDLKLELGKIGVDTSKGNIDAKKIAIVASPGEISRGPFIQTLYAALDVTDYVIILQSDCYSLYSDLFGNKLPKTTETDYSLQQIYYGAPGTGKSHTINKKTEGESVIRTTFHPDSDYSTFVGAYKPTMDLLPICNEIGQEMKLGNTVLHKEQIVYKFVSQAFLQAYVQAWKYYAEDAEEVKKQFLVIEEINRGNCAQIFGDLFQLLDRNDSGFSDYPIKADEDMKKFLSKELHSLEISNAENINALYKGRNVVNEVINGDILLLPNNLYIWATMNTSDQSLFPIDSAFKRRWDWQYVPINKGYDKNGKEIQWVIETGNKRYDWWDFLQKINHEIDDTTHSEDKKLGFFFCKAEENIISAEKFVSKVIFYLWNDVFKNYGFDKPFFKKGDGNTLAFSDFYKTDNSGNTSVKEDVVEMFLDKLKVDGVEAEITSEANEIEPSTVIKVNGKQTKFKNEIPYTAIKEYVRLNSDKTAQEIYDIWEPFKKCSIRKWIVLNKEDYDNMNENERNYSYKIDCADGNSIWVNKDGWTYHPQKKYIKDSISAFIKAVHEANLGITITEESI